MGVDCEDLMRSVLLRGRAAGVKRWIVADMDDTLVRKLRLPFRTSLATSPCFEPLIQWLGAGNGLIVVTSDDGFRPFNNLWDAIPQRFRAEGRVLLSTSDGATLFTGDEQGNLAPVTGYTETAAARSTYLPSGDGMQQLLDACRQVVVPWLSDLRSGAADMATLQPSVAKSWKDVLSQVPPDGDLEQFVTAARLSTPAAMLPRGSVLWRNQAGPAAHWIREGTQTDAWFGYDAAATSPLQPSFSNLFIMGMPRTHSKELVDTANVLLAPLGLVASAAPNSVCIKNGMVDKSLPLKYLQKHQQESGFAFHRAVSFGDNPSGNDAPLARCSAQMNFFSVANELEQTPEDLRELHVGSLEGGTAAVIWQLLQLPVEDSADGFDKETLVQVAERVSRSDNKL